MGKEYVGIDLHRRRSVIYRMDEAGERRCGRGNYRERERGPGYCTPLRSEMPAIEYEWSCEGTVNALIGAP
jgi:hypothetical protein